MCSFAGRDGTVFNHHFDGDGAIIYKQASALAVKASCRSGLARHIDLAAPIIGRRSRTRRRRR
jgi:hypothetical protein